MAMRHYRQEYAGFVICVAVLLWCGWWIPRDQSSARIVAYYQSNGALRAAMAEVLTRFNEYYPHAPLHFHNDGGQPNLERVVRAYGVRNYTYAPHKESYTDMGMYFNTSRNGAAYLVSPFDYSNAIAS